MTERKAASKRRFLHQRQVPGCTCKLEKSKDTILEGLLKFASLSVIVVGFISSLLHYSFAINAEKFYGVSSLYFYKDRIFDFGATALFILIPLFIWLIPFFVRKDSKTSEFNFIDRILFSLAVAILVLLESLFFSDRFFENTKLYVSLSLGFSILSFVGYDFLFFVIARNNANEGTKKCKLTRFYTKNSKVITKISEISYAFIAVIILLMTFCLIMRSTPLDPTNQKGYEFIYGKESGYRIVVGHYQNSVVLMRGSTEGDNLTIVKGDYRVEPLGERQIKYRQFDKVDVN